MDYIFQFFNLFMTSLIYFHPFREANFLKVTVFIYGITAATSNIVHSYAYLVFEKAMFQKMTSLSRGSTMIGHMIGSIFGNILIKIWCNTERAFSDYFIGEMKREASGGNWQSILNAGHYSITKIALKHLRKHELNWYGLTFVISIVVVIMSGIVAWSFPKPKKEPHKGSNFKEIVRSAGQLKKRRVMFWALSWSITFLTMLYAKSWSSSLWKFHQNRLQQSAENGLYDAIAYFFGFVGSFIPAYVVRLGDHTAIMLQLLVIVLSSFSCVLQAMEINSMYFYYWMHSIFTCLLYYSLTYQNSELAKSIEHSRIKMVFNVLSFMVFIAQNVMNLFIDGMLLVPAKSIHVRYVIMAFALGMTFLIIFVGFAGNVSGGMDDDKEDDLNGESEKKPSEVNLETQAKSKVN